MLVIRRRAGESILVGDGIEVSVIDISPTRVKLGILAPANVLILRKELRLAEAENLAAAQAVSGAAVAALLEQLRRGAG
jgi:carbon storage regulator